MCFIQEQNGVLAEGMWIEIRLMVECMSLEEFFCVECQVGVCLLRHANTPHATHQRTLVSIPSGHKLWMPDYRQPHLDLESSPTPLGSSVWPAGRWDRMECVRFQSAGHCTHSLNHLPVSAPAPHRTPMSGSHQQTLCRILTTVLMVTVLVWKKELLPITLKDK